MENMLLRLRMQFWMNFQSGVFFPVKYSCLQNKKELNTTTYDTPKWREKRNRRQEKKAGLTKLTKVFPLIHSQTATKSSKKRLTILNCKCKISAPLSYLVASFVQVICLIIWRRFSTRWFAKRFDSVAQITSFCFSYYGKWSIFLIRSTTGPQKHKTLYVY